MRSRELLFALLLVVVVMFFAIPESPWEFDETLFFLALHHYDPVAHHPPPPGYPLFALTGQLLRPLLPSDFATLLTISFIGSAAAFAMFALAFGKIAGDATAGIAGALLFFFSPAMLVHSTLPISEPGALALLGAALYFLARGDAPLRFAVFAALAVGWRIQFSIFVVPLFLTAVLLMRGWRNGLKALAAFTVVCLLWLTPLAMAVGGVEEMIRFELGQGRYLAAHDADVSRSGWTAPQIALRFVAHPWGVKMASFPLLVVAVSGALQLVRRREFLPFGIAGALYLGFALYVMDPADGVRYAIPSVLVTACCAGAGLRRLRPAMAYALVAVFGAGSLVYVSSLLFQRSTTSSPPLQAVEYARKAFPSNATALYELPLWPHATYFLADRNPHRVDQGLAKFYDRPDIPLFIYADGTTAVPGARVFRWAKSDAYSKLTRNHYRVASIIPLPPERRYRVMAGIHAPEREADGEEWRWIASPGELQLPRGPARTVTLRVGLPVIYPLQSNALRVFVDGALVQRVALERARPVEISFDVAAGAPVIRFEAERSFVPAEVPGSLNRDRRRLSVKLYELRTSAAAAAAARRAA